MALLADVARTTVLGDDFFAIFFFLRTIVNCFSRGLMKTLKKNVNKFYSSVSEEPVEVLVSMS